MQTLPGRVSSHLSTSACDNWLVFVGREGLVLRAQFFRGTLSMNESKYFVGVNFNEERTL